MQQQKIQNLASTEGIEIVSFYKLCFIKVKSKQENS